MYVWDAIDVINPRVVITEYNGKFPPDIEWTQSYNANHVWDGSDWHGASLKAFEKLAQRKGYRLVGTNIRGCNAFFVRTDLAKDLFYEESTAEALYNPLRMNLQFVNNHKARYCLINQKEGYGLLNYQNYELEGFYEQEDDNWGIHAWMKDKTSIIKLLIPPNKKEINISYEIPDKMINYGFKVHALEKNGNSKECKIDRKKKVISVQLDDLQKNDRIIDVEIKVDNLWRPSEIIKDSNDVRSLGVDIILSKIQFN